jgi:uncharacterized OB-fold protein
MIRSAPRLGREATPHWKAAREGRFVLPYCASCDRYEWPPRANCGRCTRVFGWRECAGTGAVVTYSVVHRAVTPEWKTEVPYVVAMIELDEGVRLLSNIVDCEPNTLRCGLRVRCRFVETTDPELGLVVFFPDVQAD